MDSVSGKQNVSFYVKIANTQQVSSANFLYENLVNRHINRMSQHLQ